MQNFIITVLMAANVFIALIIIVLVLLQPSKEGALGAPLGGVGESVFGAQTGGHLTKLTVIFSILFLSITLVLAIIIGHRAQPKALMDKELSIKELPLSDISVKDENEGGAVVLNEAENDAETGKREAENILNDASDVLVKKASDSEAAEKGAEE